MSVFSASGFLNPEQADAYSNALIGLVGTDDPVLVLRATPAALEAALKRFPADRLGIPESPGKWSAAMVFAHLADSELVTSFRLRMILAHDRPALTPYDQDLWASGLHYDRVSPAENVERFSVMRRANLVLWADATPQELSRVGIHGERGEESVERQRRLLAGHDLLHLNQISRIREAVG